MSNDLAMFFKTYDRSYRLRWACGECGMFATEAIVSANRMFAVGAESIHRKKNCDGAITIKVWAEDNESKHIDRNRRKVSATEPKAKKAARKNVEAKNPRGKKRNQKARKVYL